MHLPHSPYYRDRLTERDLCHDFPADEIFIDGLHAMQSHFHTRNVSVDIPVMRVMNAAHFLLAYAFNTTCSGDQTEYDVLAYGSVGHDKQVMLVTLIVLAAMLKRTEGFRARQCRNLLLEDRCEDFYEGVSLYDQFLNSAEKHFAEEDFLIDTHSQIVQLQEENTRLTSENINLHNTITQMETKLTQINIKEQNNNCTQIENQYITYLMPTPEAPNCSNARQTSATDVPQQEWFKYIHVCVIDDKERAEIHRMVCNIVRLPKMQLVCGELYKLMKKRKVLCSINPDAMLAELRRLGLPTADVNGFSDKNFYHYYKAPKVD